MDENDIEKINISEITRNQSLNDNSIKSEKKSGDDIKSVEKRYQDLKEFYRKSYSNNMFLKALIKELNLPNFNENQSINDGINNDRSDEKSVHDLNLNDINDNGGDNDNDDDNNNNNMNNNNNNKNNRYLKALNKRRISRNKLLNDDDANLENDSSDGDESADEHFHNLNLNNNSNNNKNNKNKNIFHKALEDYKMNKEFIKEKLKDDSSNSMEESFIKNTNSDWINDLKEDLFFDKCTKDMKFLDKAYKETMKNSKIDKLPRTERLKSTKRNENRKHDVIDKQISISNDFAKPYTWTIEKIGENQVMEIRKNRNKDLEEKIKDMGRDFWEKKLGKL